MKRPLPLLSHFPQTRHWLPALALSLAAPAAAQAQTLFNGAGNVFTIVDSVVYVMGSVENQGTLRTQAGRLLIDQGNFVSTGDSRPGLGRVRLDGGAAGRTVTLAGDTLHRLDLNVPANTTLGSNGVIKGTLALLNGHLETTLGFQLRLGPVASVVNETSTHYVKGSLVQQKALSGNSAIDYGQMGVTVNPAGQSITLEVDRRSGVNTLNYSYGQNPNVGTNQSIDRIWRLSTPGGVDPASPVTITLSWLSDNDNGHNFNTSLAQVLRSNDNGATWQVEGLGQNAAGRSVTFSPTDLNAWYTVGSQAAPLPVEMLSFTAEARSLDAVLTWRTARERNSDYFGIERSAEGRTWQQVGRVQAAGNSDQVREYNSTDAGAGRLGSAFYYRLRQVDRDGTTKYTELKLVRFRAAPVLTVEAYPVPLKEWLTLDATAPADGPIAITVHDAAGRLVMQQELATVAGLNTWRLDVSRLAAGAYSLRATQGQQSRTIRLVK